MSTKSIFVGASIVLIALLLYVTWNYFPLVNGYQVLAIPYAGWKAASKQERLYGQNAGVTGLGSAASSLLMVAGFWHLRDETQQKADPQKLLTALPENDQPRSLEDIADYAEELGYKTRIESAPLAVWSLGPMGRKGRPKGPPTPVIVDQSLSRDHSGKGQIFRVVVGASRFAREIYTQDYLYGPYHAISRQDFVTLWRSPHRFLVIEPKDRRSADSQGPRFERYTLKELPPDVVRLRSLWYVAEETRRQRKTEEAIPLWEQLTNDAEYNASFNRTDKVYHYTVLYSLYFKNEQYADIFRLENRVVNLNKDLNYEAPGSPENFETWVLLGRAYLAVRNKEKARSYAQRALVVNPNDPAAQFLLDQSR